MQLADYYFASADLFVIPIEHLSRTGMSARFRDLLRERQGVSDAWTELFDAAFASYWERVTVLSDRAPRYWFPPRLQHCCVVTKPTRVRPYFQPFNKCSWLLYASDFDPETSNREFAAYQFVHAERMGLLQEVTETVVRNLAYWLVRSEDEIEMFSAGCRQTRRPDAPAFRALAEAMPWIRRLHDQSLKPPLLVTLEPALAVPHTGILITRDDQARLDALVGSATRAAQAAMRAFQSTYARRGRDCAPDLCDWLRAARPGVVVAGLHGRVLWDPDEPERIGAVRAVLRGIGESAAHSVQADLTIIDERTRQFLGSLRRPQDLPVPRAGMAQTGLSYMDGARRLIAYNLREPGMDRLGVPAPPYERLMLAARTIHEWGHLAADAGWVPVAPERRAEHDRLATDLEALYEEVYRAAPAAIRAYTAEDTARLVKGGAVGKALARISLGRLPDYQANLLARRYLESAELETYIRNNVYTLAFEASSTALFRRLARYAYEYQYLRFSRVPDARTYFLSSTWFVDEYLRRGVLTEALWERLVRTIAAVCDCYILDRAPFTPEFVAAEDDSGGAH